ncbi:DENN domain-containing protein 1B-like isoform X2 [Hyperolius riggenbachi]|uniref:DENN domain-containing protein 1B-like isoform X2 n=1 Tax=Hyperolius riggenbachi TaxID=752182 RepID=UPI0035A3792D
MGSRIKENPERIFEGYFEVLRPVSPDKDPELKIQFPDHFDDQDSVTTLTKFCFPFDVDRWQNASVQHFSFTLTDLQGYQRFGFCRLSVNAKSCTCILSCLPWFELFYKLLNHIAEHLVKDQLTEVMDILQSLYDHPVPEVNGSLSLEMFSYFVAPDPTRLPTIPENRNLTEFLVAVQVDTMLQLYSSLLCERRILITSSKLSTLTACVHASAALLYPMYWQHIYIPTLPPHLLDYCCAPMPYLIGVHSSLMEVNAGALEDAVIFNMDTNFLETPFHDLDSLPPHVVSLLKLQLTKQSAFMGDKVSRAFLRAQALLFGSYREALICTPGEPISFCQETFLSHKCSSMRTFLQNAVHLQLFSQFIDSRLEKLNSGDEFTDVFEQEVTKCGLTGASRSYQLWLENLKKGGGTLLNNVKNRTHPTVRNMLRYVRTFLLSLAKGQAKTGLKGMKRRIKQKDQHQIQRMGSFKSVGSPTESHERLQDRRPIMQHFGQSRPRRPGKKYSEGDSWDSQSEEGAREPGDPGATEDHDFPLLDEGMDLLNEIFETLNTRAPGGDHVLYGAHSLDCFRLEDSQYFGQFQSSEEDLQLTMSQPRDSNLWYLQEVDEGSLDDLESLEDNSSIPDNLSSASEYTSHSMEVATSDITSTNEQTTSLTTEDITPMPEIPSEMPNTCSSTTGTITSSEVLPSDTEDTLQTPSDSSEVKITPPAPETEILATKNEESTKKKNILSTLPREYTAMRNASSGTPFMVSGPSVRSVVSRFQVGTLDPRMVWTGTRRESEEAERLAPTFRSFNTMRPISQAYNSPKSSLPAQRIGPVFLRTNSTPKMAIPVPSSFTSDSGSAFRSAQDVLGTTPEKADRIGDEEECNKVQSPLATELPLSSLPKVSELKKKFEG